MKKISAIVVIALLAGVLLAQTFAPPALLLGPPVATSTTQCGTPAAHQFAICPVETAGVIAPYFWNGASWAQMALPTLALVATSGKYSDLTGTPVLSSVATSGKYSDLTGTPALPNFASLGTGINCPSAVLNGGILTCPAGSSIK